LAFAATAYINVLVHSNVCELLRGCDLSPLLRRVQDDDDDDDDDVN